MKPAKFQEQEQQDLTNNNYFSKEDAMTTKTTTKPKTSRKNNRLVKKANNLMQKTNRTLDCTARSIPTDTAQIATPEDLALDVQKTLAAVPDETLLGWTGIAQLTACWCGISGIDLEKLREPLVPFSVLPTPFFIQHLSHEQRGMLFITLTDWMEHLIEVVSYHESD